MSLEPERHRRIIGKALAAVRPVFRLDLRHGCHGIGHWSRVWYHGKRLAAAVEVNPDVLAWFAYLHDSQRHDDGRDRGHGRRAADFAVRLRREGVVSELNPPEFERLCEAMRLHSEAQTEGDPALRACWDADRLDLGRVGIVPVAHRLCTDYARDPAVIQQACQLATRTRSRRR